MKQRKKEKYESCKNCNYIDDEGIDYTCLYVFPFDLNYLHLIE